MKLSSFLLVLSTAFCWNILLVVGSHSKKDGRQCESAKYNTCGNPADEEKGWEFIAWMAPDGDGMFDFPRGLIDPCMTLGVPVTEKDLEVTTADFQMSFDEYYSSAGNELLFITGDETIYIKMSYEQYTRTAGYSAPGPPNTLMQRCMNGVVDTHFGNIINRGNDEDPWVAIAGAHDDSRFNGYIIWGNDNYAGSNRHNDLKERHGGVKVYFRPLGCPADGYGCV